MKIINTKVHGVLDYLMGILLIASPWILNFADGTAAQYVPIALGITMIIMSILTDYELGVVKTLSMKTHLTIDLISGIFLAASPWLFNFDERVYLPHLILGILEIGAAIMTDRVPYHNRRTADNTHNTTAHVKSH